MNERLLIEFSLKPAQNAPLRVSAAKLEGITQLNPEGTHMLTFIRIAVQPYTHKGSLRPKPPAPSDLTPPEDCKQENPWQKELQRLASPKARISAEKPGYRPPTITQLPPPPDPNPKAPEKRTEADTGLKVWWGKSLSTYEPIALDLSHFEPARRKPRPNKWFS